MKTYQYILLNWDGTLATTLDVWLTAFRTVTEKRGLHLTNKQISDSFGDFPNHMRQWGVQDADAAQAEAEIIAKQQLPDADLYPDALEVLEQLHKSGKQIALITTSPHDYLDNLLEKHNLSGFLDAVIAGDDVTNHKPHPEPLEVALAALGGNKNDAVMIGDSDKDIAAANNTGVDSILFYPLGHTKFYDLEKLKQLQPTHIVDDFRAVLKLI
jgi:pyrophosphatase PpaX